MFRAHSMTAEVANSGDFLTQEDDKLLFRDLKNLTQLSFQVANFVFSQVYSDNSGWERVFSREVVSHIFLVRDCLQVSPV